MFFYRKIKLIQGTILIHILEFLFVISQGFTIRMSTKLKL